MLQEPLYRRCLEQLRVVIALHRYPAVLLLSLNHQVATDQFIRVIRTAAGRSTATLAGGNRTGQMERQMEQRRVRCAGLRADRFDHGVERILAMFDGFLHGD